MYHVLVQFDVPPAKREEFIAAALGDANGSLANEPGTRRFEVIRDENNPNRVYLDEVYDSAEAFETHCQGEAIERFYELIDNYAYGPNFLFKGHTVEDSGSTVDR
ncbi:putative quinol monooxygenase [Nocardia terpenica]|uniref:Antibiotic biosynthesis monooxygenase n=1 Tax=Nocardia terpenica TaxID=455432 RepID=A0A164PPJ4_9NOCA|nr:putative quinol monooxygenase [Nocardia terpenica]KZM75871.1 antibiotic biosynthesis monooxygenase [Nocardia terpenica]NQE86197.1 antibiotic biosynthesis monooxygenase [Nocardia terpenica]